MESNPKGPPRRSRNKSLDLCLGWEKKCKGKWSTIEYRSAAIQVFCRIQVFYIIHIFCRMTLADEAKLSLIPFWSNKNYMAHKGPNPLSNRKNCLDTRKWGLFRSCLNALVKPIDGWGEILAFESRLIESLAFGIISRCFVYEPLWTNHILYWDR